jgi:hypothetical protein
MAQFAFIPSGAVSKYEILDARLHSSGQEVKELCTKEVLDVLEPIT